MPARLWRGTRLVLAWLLERPTRLGYGGALLIGLYWTWCTIPGWAAFGRLPQGRPANADFIQHVMGQRYFWHQPWHLHAPLTARLLDAPHGVMIGLTDSLPLVSILLKPLVPLLPAGFQAVTPWLILSWVLQPVAAVYALRGTGERRLVPALVVAACASAMPSFLMRAAHAALSSHFLLLFALGLSLRLASPRPPRYAVAAAVLLLPALLLIHPYLMAMAAVVLAAAPVTLALKGARRRAAMLAACLGASAAATFGLAWALGYIGRAEAGGFGFYSMNLLSPVWPTLSGLTGGMTTLDATGGQYEGYQYLGLGVLAGLAMLALRRQGRQAVVRAAWSHPGLLIACIGLTVFALSNRVYAGSLLLASLPKPPGADIFRVSGRFFWPVGYVLLVGMVAALAAHGTRRLAPLALVAIAVLQTADARSLWLLDRVNLRVTPIQTLDTGALRQAMVRSRTLSVYPAWPCHATRTGAVDLMDVLNVADSVLIPIDTMYTARATHAPNCDPAKTLEAPLAAGELRVILPDEAGQLGRVPQSGRFCRMNGRFGVCARGSF